MSITNPSENYFEEVASQWDALRSSYFTEEVRSAALAKAYLHPQMVVGDVGAGTGFMTAGLAPLVKRVYALDGSSAMLDVAQKNLAHVTNITYQSADGLSLPLPDDSLDAVFANMYLHHCPDPLAAVREMVRILRPGGRLILTDMDAHPYTWLKTEMADVWQGFERSQVSAWLHEAGLVNRIIDCTGTSCCAESHAADLKDASERQAQVSIFVAVGTKPVAGVEEAVRKDYTAHAISQSTSCSCSVTDEETSACCGSGEPSSCCGPSAEENAYTSECASRIRGYSDEERAEIPADAVEVSLGCGNPTAIAALQPGETVLDIGSGGGIDAFLAANRVGKTGQVIGVDMTPAMIERARRSAEKQGYTQVEFRLGQADALPVEDSTVDVILSNCVINLTRDKGQVFAEAFRALRPGGRLEVSDVLSDRSLPNDLLEDPSSWAGCISGALPEGEYVDLIRQAGFEGVAVRRSYSSGEVSGTHLFSALVSARKP
jgi:arsenite methyltransferase